jgi:hypothetical protein
METLERTGFKHLLWQDRYQPEDLAELLEIDVSLIRHSIFMGELHATVLDHHILEIRRGDVLHWLSDRD